MYKIVFSAKFASSFSLGGVVKFSAAAKHKHVLYKYDDSFQIRTGSFMHKLNMRRCTFHPL